MKQVKNKSNLRAALSLSLYLSLLILGSVGELKAQVLRVPSGTSGIGTSGNQNVGIGVVSPQAKLDMTTNSGVGGLRLTGAFLNQSPTNVVYSPYAFRVDLLEEIINPGPRITTTFLDMTGKLYLGNFGNSYSSSHNLNMLAGGLAIYGSGTNKLTATYNFTHGNLITWTTNNTTATTRNLGFAYGTNAPFFFLTPENKVAIGTTNTNGNYKLFIGGKGIAEELVVRLQANWPDYVFTSDYDMLSNNQLRQYIAKNGKLPYLPAAKEVADTGLALGETQAQLTRLVEELTLRLLQMEERIEELEQELAKQ